MSMAKSFFRSFFILIVALSLTFSSLGIISTKAVYAKSSGFPAGLSADDWARIKSQMPATTIDAQQAYIKASNTEPSNSSFSGDRFGYSMALSGDTLVIGAPYEDSNATGVNGDQTNNLAVDAGAVYVFIRNGSTWTQQAYLKASNTGVNDYFGYSVAISGDTVAVGAIQEDSNATGINGNQTDNTINDSGAVYVFTRSGTDWSQQAYIKESNTGVDDSLGMAIALDGDTLAVGALESSNASGVNGNQTDDSLTYSGAVYVFTRSGTDWSQQAYIKASNPGQYDRFGISVSLDADTLAVGAFDESSNATGINGAQNNDLALNAGAAYIFTRSGIDWSQQAYIKASNTGPDDQFGTSVAVAGDTLVVGAPQEDSIAQGINGDQANNSFTDAGAAYVFTRSGGTWNQQAYLKASNTEMNYLYTNAFFGGSVAISENKVLVGAGNEAYNTTGINGVLPQMQSVAEGSGAAYFFTRNDNLWKQQAYIKASNTYTGDHFGNSIALDGDTVVAGAPNEQSVATGINGDQTNSELETFDLTKNAGSAYVLLVPPLVTESKRVNANPTSATTINFSVSFSEPMTGVDASDFHPIKTGTLTSVSVTGVSGGPTTYTVTVGLSATGTGTIRLDVVDDDSVLDVDINPLGGTGSENGDFTVGEIYEIDRTGPRVVSILRTETNPTNLSMVNFDVTFNEPVSGVNLSDFQVVTSGAITGAMLFGLTPNEGDASKYMVSVKTGLHIGSLRLNLVDNDSILDVVSNRLGGTGIDNGNFSGQAYNVDRVFTVSFYSASTQDGWVLESSENSNVGGTLNANNTTFALGDDAFNRQYRAILSFPTTPLPDGAVIKSAVININQYGAVVGSNPFNSLGNLWVDIRRGALGTIGLQLVDFNAPVSASKVGNFKSTFYGYMSTLNAAGRSYINKTGPTQFRLYFGLDDNNNHKADIMRFDSDYDSSTKPKLTIVYVLP